MSVSKRIGANRQAEIDMRNARIDMRITQVKSVLTSKPVVYTGYALAGTCVVVCGYVMMCVAALMDQGVM